VCILSRTANDRPSSAGAFTRPLQPTLLLTITLALKTHIHTNASLHFLPHTYVRALTHTQRSCSYSHSTITLTLTRTYYHTHQAPALILSLCTRDHLVVRSPTNHPHHQSPLWFSLITCTHKPSRSGAGISGQSVYFRTVRAFFFSPTLEAFFF
jgi:hypothetical protein